MSYFRACVFFFNMTIFKNLEKKYLYFFLHLEGNGLKTCTRMRIIFVCRKIVQGDSQNHSTL